MAERRMFAKSIIDSDAFLDMPLSTQALYFHLSMRADDEGFVNNPKRLIRFIGAADDEMKVLLAKKFILSFDSGVIVIKHWKIHNYIQKDRFKETNYHDEKALLSVNENNSYSMDTNCVHDVLLGKVRLELGKYSKEDIYHFNEIVNYLNLKANTKYKSTSSKTKDLIKARFNDGFTLEDFKIVIDKKTTEWLKDKKMSIYLRPETLFSNKFEGYLNQVVAKSTLDLSGKTYDCSRDDEEF